MSASADLRIQRAEVQDAAALLELRRLAFESEARRYNNSDLAPLRQTLEEMQAEFATSIILKALCGDVAVGTVRGEQRGETCQVGRLAVHPDYRRRGIARRLMLELEARFPAARRFELYTGAASPDNIQLYLGLGYQKTGRRMHPEDPIEFVCLAKARA